MSQSVVSIILPVMNQAEHIARVLESHAAALERSGIAYELVPVVNGSTDASFAECQRVASANPAVRPIEERGRGFGRAIRSGLAVARGDVLAYANSARTSTDDLVTVIRFALRNPEYVVKTTRSTYDSIGRRVGSICFNLLCRWLYHLKCWDMNGTPKVFARRFERLCALTQNDSMIDTEFNAVCALYDYPMIELPLAATPRHSGKSSTNIRSAVLLYWAAFRYASEFKRQHGLAGAPAERERV